VVSQAEVNNSVLNLVLAALVFIESLFQTPESGSSSGEETRMTAWSTFAPVGLNPLKRKTQPSRHRNYRICFPTQSPWAWERLFWFI